MIDIFCIIDMDGFSVNGKFLCKEMGVTQCKADVTWCFSLKLPVDKWQLSSRDRFSVNYVTRNIHGLPFANRHGDLDMTPSQIISSYLVPLMKPGQAIGYKGGTVERNLLISLSIPFVDLEKYGCPRFDQLCEIFKPVLKRLARNTFCMNHLPIRAAHKAHCPSFETVVFNFWLKKYLENNGQD